MEGVGRLPESMKFDGNLDENFKKFYQSFELYLVATEKDKKADTVKIALLLNTIGSEGIETYNTFRLTSTQKSSYEAVVNEFKKYCAPRKNRTYERFVFNSRNQQVDEPFDKFFGDLKKLIQSCEYADQEDTILVDRIILGTNDLKVQEKLLNIQNVTLETAVETCRNYEATKKQLQSVRNKEEATVDFVRRQKQHNKQKEERGKTSTEENSGKHFKCKKCDKVHGHRECAAFGKTCYKCGKMNHFSNVCKTKLKNVKDVTKDEESESEEDDLYVSSIVRVGELSKKTKSIWTEVIEVNGKALKFKIDTGSEVNIIPLVRYKSIAADGSQRIRRTRTLLQAYGGGKIKPIGKVKLRCKNTDRDEVLEFIVVDLDVKLILGLPSIQKLGYIKNINNIQINSDKEKFIQSNIDVFTGLGTFKDTCTITLKKNSEPVARPCRRVPLAVKSKLKSKLEQLEKQKIIAKVNGASEWVNPLVIIEKPNKTLRLCLDPQELNKCIEREFFEIPSSEEINSKLSGKQYFTVLDFVDGFYQVKLDSESSKFTVFSTPFGCYKFLRLPFGIKTAPEIFQKMNQKNFGDIDNVIIYFDDLLIAANSKEEHDKILHKVINRAREKGVKFNKEKVQYRKTEVKYMGHIFNREGMRIDKDRIRAIDELKPPTCKKELQRLLGLINYVRKFIPKLGEIASPICDLLRKDIEFQWLEAHDKALSTIKSEISKNTVLMNFDPTKQITIQTDASLNGIGCCLMQEGRPVAYASRGLNETEKKYAVIEKEMLSIVYATQRFHNYIYGRQIKVITDHKPNVFVLNKRICQVHSPRLQRLKLKLLKYDIKLEYLPGKYLYIADCLSRNYSNEVGKLDKDMNEIVHSVEKHLRMSENKKEEFRLHTKRDVILSDVCKYWMNGWKCKKYEGELKVFYQIRNDLHVYKDMIFYNDRVVVPKRLREKMLKLLHEGHFGINRTYDRAREILFWPGMSMDIKKMIQNCKVCERYRYANVKEPLIAHEIPKLPFQKIASDILEFGGKSYLVIVDYLTKWLEIILLKSKQSCDIIETFKKVFATHGIPDIVIADNMPYSSYECQRFAKEYDFEFQTSSPGYPKSNGLAERFVQTAKNILKKSEDVNGALMEYRNTPITSLKRSPAELLYQRKLKTKLPVVEKVNTKIKKFRDELQNRNKIVKKYYDRNAKPRDDFKNGDTIVYKRKKQWQPAVIVSKHKSPRSYLVNTGSNILRRNSNHLKKSVIKHETSNTEIDNELPETRINQDIYNNNNNTQSDANRDSIASDNEAKEETSKESVRPVRARKVPSKFNNYVLY
jgi:hypothetical protein